MLARLQPWLLISSGQSRVCPIAAVLFSPRARLISCCNRRCRIVFRSGGRHGWRLGNFGIANGCAWLKIERTSLGGVPAIYPEQQTHQKGRHAPGEGRDQCKFGVSKFWHRLTDHRCASCGILYCRLWSVQWSEAFWLIFRMAMSQLPLVPCTMHHSSIKHC